MNSFNTNPYQVDFPIALEINNSEDNDSNNNLLTQEVIVIVNDEDDDKKKHLPLGEVQLEEVVPASIQRNLQNTENIREVLQENLDQVLQRGYTLEQMDTKCHNMEVHAEIFQTEATETRRRGSCRLCLTECCIMSFLIGFFVFVLYHTFY